MVHSPSGPSMGEALGVFKIVAKVAVMQTRIKIVNRILVFFFKGIFKVGFYDL